MKKSNQRKVASVLSVAILLTGTFAWQSFSQMALNESSHYSVWEYEVGARLHDHYNGENKDVFVENYADADTGTWVYTRIRLDEYYEYGTGAGTTDTAAEGYDVTVVRGDLDKDGGDGTITPTFGQVETWDTYDWGSVADDSSIDSNPNIRTYRELDFAEAGDAKVYMPTFNKHKYDLEPEYNGTYAGIDGDRTTDYDRYKDYVEYTVGEESDITATAYAEEGNEFDYFYEPVSTHFAKETTRLTSNVISMADWKLLSSEAQIGAFWVYDTDGWAYWAQPILQQTASGALLDGVTVTTASEDHEEWYYAVNVICEIASAGDWGVEPDDGNSIPGTGMYTWFTQDGIDLLDTISDGDTSGLNAEEVGGDGDS